MEWTTQSQAYVRAGGRKCTKCGTFKPVDCFGTRKNSGGTKALLAECKQCLHKRQYQSKQAFIERWGQKERRQGYKEGTTYARNREDILRKQRIRAQTEKYKQQVCTANKKRYHESKAAMCQNILEQDECDFCGDTGARFFWRRLNGRDFDCWYVFHHECAAEAKREGMISKGARIRPKRELERESETIQCLQTEDGNPRASNEKHT